MSGLRWPVETALEEGKTELGMDHYETTIRPKARMDFSLSVLNML